MSLCLRPGLLSESPSSWVLDAISFSDLVQPCSSLYSRSVLPELDLFHQPTSKLHLLSPKQNSSKSCSRCLQFLSSTPLFNPLLAKPTQKPLQSLTSLPLNPAAQSQTQSFGLYLFQILPCGSQRVTALHGQCVGPPRLYFQPRLLTCQTLNFGPHPQCALCRVPMWAHASSIRLGWKPRVLPDFFLSLVISVSSFFPQNISRIRTRTTPTTSTS